MKVIGNDNGKQKILYTMFIVVRGIVYAMYIVTEDGSDHLR